jgi:cytochrome P450
MSALTNFVVAPWRTFSTWIDAIWSLLRLIALGLRALLRGSGPLGSRIAAELLQPDAQRLACAVLRAFAPTLTLSRVFVKAYENTGTAVLTRREDVLDVLSRDDDFEVVYGPRMRQLTGGENFFLGMQPSWPYQRDVSAMRLAARQSDVTQIVLPRAGEGARDAVRASKGALDVPQQLSLVVPADMVAHYFGTPGPTREAMIEWTTLLFWYLFLDLGASPELGARSLAAAADLRTYLDRAVAERKRSQSDRDDVLNRCLALQRSGTPGMDDLGIRNNLLGLVIGAIPTLSKAACLVLDALLDRPQELAGAQAAARDEDEARTAQYIWEALRFNPHNPVIYRRATCDAVVARSTLRQRTIPRGTLVFAVNFSAMFDPLAVPEPTQFCVDRPWSTYIHWGYGLHTCFGAHINRAVLPAMLMPLLQQRNLRRAPGARGRIDPGDTPFPQHFHLEFDPD